MIQHTSAQFRRSPIAVTDSGVGGFSVMRELQQVMPHEDFVYLADQGHVPYGPRTMEQIQKFEEGITRLFLEGFEQILPAKMIVIACNTASAAALRHVRATFPQIKFVGTEPAIKPAAERSRSKHIGVIATAATFQTELYASLIDRFAQGQHVHKRACPEFVTLVERGGPYDEADQQQVSNILAPLKAEGIDELVLGCTHFPFLMPLIQTAMGSGVEIIDPSPAIARQAARVLKEADACGDSSTAGYTLYLTSGDEQHFRKQLEALLGVQNPDVRLADWSDDDESLVIAT
ncbi:MAG: glutamate racemase [Chloroflexi bacterium]|nr:glutamate racemase [Chloroflexota bacterium]